MSVAPLWMNTHALTGATSIALSTNGVWILDSSNNLHSWNEGTALWDPQHTPPTTFAYISAAADGSMIGISISGEVYLYTNGVWTLDTSTVGVAVSVSISDADHYVVVDSTGTITRMAFGFPTLLTSGPISLTATSSPTLMFGTDVYGNIYQWDETLFDWVLIPGNLSQIHVSDAGILLGTNAAGEAYSWDGSGWTYIHMPSAIPFAWVGQFDGVYWAITINGDVWTA